MKCLHSFRLISFHTSGGRGVAARGEMKFPKAPKVA